MKTTSLLTGTACLLGLLVPFANALNIPNGTRHEEENVTHNEENIVLGRDSFYQGKNISISWTGTGYALGGNHAKGISLTADEDKWNLIFLTNTDNADGVELYYMNGPSVISRTKIAHTVAGNGIQVFGGGSIQEGTPDLILSDVEIYMVGTNSRSGYAALNVTNKAYVTNANELLLQARSETQQNLILAGDSRIDLTNTRMELKKGVAIGAGLGSNISISNSSVTSSSNNILVGSIGSSSAYTTHVSLDNVDLSQAVNQRIVAMEGHLVVNLTNGTVLNGYVVPSATEGLDYGASEDGHITLNISAGGWKVSQSSNLGLQGELSLTNQSVLNLYARGGTDFSDITAAAIMIEQGTVINLDVSTFGGGEGTYVLLKADQFGQDNQAIVNLIGASNSPYIWDTSLLASKGTVTVRFNVIPEPATAALGLLGLAGLGLRRHRKA